MLAADPMVPGSPVGKAFRTIRRMVGDNAVVLANSAAIVIGNLSTAALGVAYWWLAARLFPPTAVGMASAMISVMGLIGAIGELGFGTLLQGEVPRHKADTHVLVNTGLLAAFCSCAAIGLIYVVVIQHLLPPLRTASGGSPAGLAFAAGCALTGFALVLDQAFTALLRSEWQMIRNILFSVIKLALLALAATMAAGRPADQAGDGILLSWVAGLGVSLIVLGALAAGRGVIRRARPDFALLWRLAGKFVDHHLLNLATQAPALILPLLVSLQVSPEANAAFYPAWMIVNVAALVPSAMTAVLYAVGMADPASVAKRLRFSLAVSACFAAGTGVFLSFFSQPVLAAFNPAYPGIAGSSLRLLGFGVLGLLVRHHYIAVVRMDNRMRRAALIFTLGGVLELGLAAWGTTYEGGLTGLAAGWLLALAVESALMLIPVFRAARS